MGQNVINYSDRDYQAIIDDLNADPDLKDLPEYVKRGPAGIFDVLNNNINATANALLLETMFSRPHAQDMLALIDYRLPWKATSSASEQVDIDPSYTVSGSYTVPREKLKFRYPGNALVQPQIWEARDDLTYTIGTDQSSITVYQQETQVENNIGLSDGTNFQLLDTPFLDVLPETSTLVIDGETYTRVDSFKDSVATSLHFRLFFRSDGSSYIMLGGLSPTGMQYGKIPTQGLPIYFNCAIGGGLVTQLAIGSIIEYIGDDPAVTTVTNTTKGVDGGDPQSLEQAKQIAPIALRASGLYGNESTGRAIVLQLPGVMDVELVKIGVLQIDAYVMPLGGGYPSTELKTLVETTLTKASFVECCAVTGKDPSYLAVGLQLRVQTLNYQSNLPIIALAAALSCSEFTDYILRVYRSSGLVEAITNINAFFADPLADYVPYTFNTHGVRIKQILDNIKPLAGGESYNREDTVTAVQGYITDVNLCLVDNPNTTIQALPGVRIQVSQIQISQIT